MRSRDFHFMNMAVNLAKNAQPAFGKRLCAIIAIRGKIISIGFNREKSHTFQTKFQSRDECIFPHAEIDAIKSALRVVDEEELSKATMYVVRVKKKPNSKKFYTGMAKPCDGCQEAIKNYNIKTVFYTTDEGTYDELEH